MVIWKSTKMFVDFPKKRQLFRENKFQIWPSITFRVVFWIASKKLGLISSAFWPKCISTHWLETWIEIYCLNFNNFCSNWEGRGAVWTNPPPQEKWKLWNSGGRGGSVTNREVIFFFGKFLPLFVKLNVLLKWEENFVNLSKVKNRKVL